VAVKARRLIDLYCEASLIECDCIVIGAGLAGLAAAKDLQSAGLTTLVLEASDRSGGRVKSDLIDGYTLDHGFQVFNSGYPHIKNTGLLKPLGFTPFVKGLIPFRIVGPITSTSDLITPFLRGVFLTDPSKVDHKVRREIYLSFLRGRAGLVRYGAGSFSAALAAPISDIHYNETVHGIDGQIVTTDQARYSARHIVVATDPVTATQLLPEIDVVRMNSSTTWYHTSDEAIPHGSRFAVNLNGALINSVAISDIQPGYAPAGRQLFSSTSLTVVSESEIRRDLAKIWGRDTSKWELVARYEIKQSLPVHPEGKPLYSPVEVRDGLFVVGDHRAYPSQQGAMESGKRAARKIIERELQAR
jgi:protoporphyrinogen oxidase